MITTKRESKASIDQELQALVDYVLGRAPGNVAQIEERMERDPEFAASVQFACEAMGLAAPLGLATKEYSDATMSPWSSLESFIDGADQHACRVYRLATEALRVWTDDAMQHAPDFAQDVLFFDYSADHKRRILAHIVPLLRGPVLAQPLKPHCGFLLYNAVMLHDLGYFLGDQSYYPDVRKRKRNASDLLRIHQRQHRILGRALLRFQQGDFPPPIRVWLSNLKSQNNVLADDVARLLRESSLPLKFLVDLHAAKSDAATISQHAASAVVEIASHKVSVPDLMYLLAVIQLGDSLDRNAHRIQEPDRCRKLFSTFNDVCRAGGTPDWGRLLQAQCVEQSKISINSVNRTINISVDVRAPECLFSSAHPLAKFLHDRLSDEFDSGHNALLKVIEDRTNHTVMGPELRLAASVTDAGELVSALRHVAEEGNTTYRGTVSRIVQDMLADCPAFNSWIKFWDQDSLIFGGEAQVADAPCAGAAEILQRMVYRPAEWGWSSFEQPHVVRDVRKQLETYYENVGHIDDVKKSLAYSERIEAEVYIPVFGKTRLLAIANVHFMKEHCDGMGRDEQLSEFAHDLAYDLNGYGTQLAQAIRSQLDRAADSLGDLWTSIGTEVNKQTLELIDSARFRGLRKKAFCLKELISHVLDRDPRLHERVERRAGEGADVLPNSSPLVELPDRDAFVQMLVPLLQNFIRDGGCVLDYGKISEMPLCYINIIPESAELQDALADKSVQRDFHSSDVFPEDVDWWTQPLGFACEARILAGIACGQIRIAKSEGGEWYDCVESSEKSPWGFRIELPLAPRPGSSRDRSQANM